MALPKTAPRVESPKSATTPTVTLRGEALDSAVSVRVIVRTGSSRAAHRRAIKGLLEISARAPLTTKEAETGTAELRRMRERGDDY